MKTFKGLILIIVSISMVIGLSACGVNQATNNNQSSSSSQKQSNTSKINKEKNKNDKNDKKIKENTANSKRTPNPIPEPQGMKKVSEFKQIEGADYYVRQHANSMWFAGGIPSFHHEVWGQLTVWSGHNDKNQTVIGTYLNSPSTKVSKKYTNTYICPRQNIGTIAITNIQNHNNKIYIAEFKSTKGVTGTFNIQTHKWTFSS